MRKIFFLYCLLAFQVGSAWSQVTIYSENFQGGPASHTFTLNTTDVSSVTDATGYNKWIVNNNYTGGSGTLFCIINLGYAIASTAQQPGAFSGGPTSFYMHILSDEAQADGILCSSYLAAEGVCNFSQGHFTAMTNSVSTVGYSNVAFNFYWLCGGSANGFGQVYYSTNNGSTWTQAGSNYSGQTTTWTLSTLTNAAFDNQPSLKFGFKFVNNTTTSAADPGFCVDEITLTGIIPASITTGNISTTTFCPNDPVSVPYTISGTFNVGNQFTAQLSDASGSFASPVNIGTLTSTSAGTISATIPGGATPGTGYRIRVVGSNPSTTGSANSTNLTIEGIPDAGVATPLSADICTGSSQTLTLTGATGNIQWQNSFNGINFNNMSGQTSATLNTGALSNNVHYRAIVSNNCGSDTSNTVSIVVFAMPTAGNFTADEDSVCDGDSVLLQLGSSTGDIQWYSSLDGNTWQAESVSASTYSTGPLSQNVYWTVTVSNGPCPVSTTDTIQITVLPYPVASFTSNSSGLSLTTNNTSTNATSYSWDFGDGNTSTQTSPTHNYSANGNYTVTLIAFNELGCADTTTSTVNILLSGNQPNYFYCDIFPNPASTSIQVEMTFRQPGSLTVVLTDLHGKVIETLWREPQFSGSAKKWLNLPSSVTPGIYFIRISLGDQWFTRKIVVQ